MADIKLAYGTDTNTAITLAGLAHGAARESRYILNSVDLFADAQLSLVLALSNNSIGLDKSIYVYFYAGTAGNYTIPATGTDAALTFVTGSNNLYGPAVISVETCSITLKQTFPSVAAFFGGVLPKEWGFVVYNMCSCAIASGGHSYRGTYFTAA